MDAAQSGVIARQSDDACVLQYDDTLDGLFTAIFESYRRSPAPAAVVGQQFQQTLGTYCEWVPSDDAKARRVEAGIRRVMGEEEYERVWTAFQSSDPRKGDILCRYVRAGMRWGRQTPLHLASDVVVAMNTLYVQVSKEAYRLRQFLRFSRREGGVYYASIAPEHDVLALIMPFFADRFCSQPFVIHDTRRGLAALYDTHTWAVVPADGAVPAAATIDEGDYQRLWKRFCDAVAIRERIHPALQRQRMPKKFWHGLTEITTIDQTPRMALPSDISRQAVQVLADAPEKTIGTAPVTALPEPEEKRPRLYKEAAP